MLEKMSYDRWLYIARERTITKSCCNQKIWVSTLSSDIAKDQHKLFKDQISIKDNNRTDAVKTEDGVSTEDSEVIDNVCYSYISSS